MGIGLLFGLFMGGIVVGLHWIAYDNPQLEASTNVVRACAILAVLIVGTADGERRIWGTAIGTGGGMLIAQIVRYFTNA